MKKVWRPMNAARHSASRTLKRLPGCRTPGGQREGSGGVVGRVAGASNRRGVRVEAEVCEDGDDCVAGSPRPPPPPWRTAWCGLRSQARVQRPFGDGAVATKTGVDLDWARVGGEGFELDPTLFGVELEEQLRRPYVPCRCGFAAERGERCNRCRPRCSAQHGPRVERARRHRHAGEPVEPFGGPDCGKGCVGGIVELSHARTIARASAS